MPIGWPGLAGPRHGGARVAPAPVWIWPGAPICISRAHAHLRFARMRANQHWPGAQGREWAAGRLRNAACKFYTHTHTRALAGSVKTPPSQTEIECILSSRARRHSLFAACSFVFRKCRSPDTRPAPPGRGRQRLILANAAPVAKPESGSIQFNSNRLGAQSIARQAARQCQAATTVAQQARALSPSHKRQQVSWALACVSGPRALDTFVCMQITLGLGSVSGRPRAHPATTLGRRRAVVAVNVRVGALARGANV